MDQNTQTTKLARVWNFLLCAAEWLKKAALTVAMIVMLIVIMPIIFVIMLFRFNPVVYWVWAMIAPQSAARSLYSDELRKILTGGHIEPVSAILNFPWMFFWKINKALRFLLPWRSKKAFIAETEFNEGSFEEHLRFFNSADQVEVINNRWLNDKERNHLWNSIGTALRDLMLPQMGRLSADQFRVLVSFGEWKTIGKYMAKYTLSSEMLCILLQATYDEGQTHNKANALVMFGHCVKLHGLSAEMINRIYADKKLPETVRKDIESSLEVFRQRQLILAYNSREQKSNWEHFCKLEGNLAEENQKLMNEMQYLVYHTTTGNALCASAVVSILSQRDFSLAKQVLQYEVVENNVINNQIRSLIAADPLLAKEFLRLRYCSRSSFGEEE